MLYYSYHFNNLDVSSQSLNPNLIGRHVPKPQPYFFAQSGVGCYSGPAIPFLPLTFFLSLVLWVLRKKDSSTMKSNSNDTVVQQEVYVVPDITIKEMLDAIP